MKAAICYYSRGGNIKKLAMLYREICVEAKTVSKLPH